MAMVRRWVILALVAAGVLGSAIKASPASSPGRTPDFLPGVAPAAGVAMLKVGTNPTVGTVLMDGGSRQVYLFLRDERNKSNCTGQCATIWPPLLTDAAPMADTGVNQSKLGTIKRDDGSTQVT